MLRLFRFRAVDSLVRCVACYSDGPSTSRAVADQEPAEIEKTRNRIRRWKSKSLSLKKEGNSVPRLDSKDLQGLVDQEEQFYAESAEEMLKVLSEIVPLKNQEKV